jgi:hypothetical protein
MNNFNVQVTKLNDGEFTEYGNRFYKIIEDNLTAWAVDKVWFEGQVKTDLSDCNTAHDDDKNPQTKNQLTTARKNAARKKLEADIHKLTEFLRGSIHVTDEDERELGIFLAPHDTHPIATTTVSPGIRVELDHVRRIKGFFSPEGSDTKGKPDGVSSTQLAHGHAPDGTIPTVKDLIHQNLDLYSKNSFMLEYDDEDRGKKVYMAARYVMRATSSGYGPWSEICFAIIP